MSYEFVVKDLPKTIAINDSWVVQREALLGSACRLEKIADQESLEKAEILLKKIGVHSKTLEETRKEFGKPYREFD